VPGQAFTSRFKDMWVLPKLPPVESRWTDTWVLSVPLQVKTQKIGTCWVWGKDPLSIMTPDPRETPAKLPAISLASPGG
jgi:hypothetical protein